MSIAAADPCTVDSAEGDCPSAGSEPILSDGRMDQTLESYINGDDCAWVACSSNNHQSSIILHQFQRDYAGTYYYHLDALGSVVALTDADADDVQKYDYSVWGQVGAWDPDHPNPYLFTGRRFDTETGLYYYRARYYHPEIGRFLQTDPIGYGDGMNVYAYCGNGPVGRIDPSGLEAIYLYNEIGDGVSYLYELTGDWDLAGIASWMGVDPDQLEAAKIHDHGIGYVLKGVGGTGYLGPSGKMGAYESLTFTDSVEYELNPEVDPLRAPTRIGSEPISPADSCSIADLHAAAGGGPYRFPNQEPIPTQRIPPETIRETVRYVRPWMSRTAQEAYERARDMGLGTNGPTSRMAAIFEAVMKLPYIAGTTAKGIASVMAGAVVPIIVRPVSPKCTCGTNVRCRVHPRGPDAKGEVFRLPGLDHTPDCDCECKAKESTYNG